MEQGPLANRNRDGLLLIGAGLLVGLLAGWLVFAGLPALPFVSAPTPGGPTATPAPAAVIGAPAPDFTLATPDGTSVTLSGLQGQVVLINFWATWCGPCRREMPVLEQKYRALREQGFTVLAVDVDDPPEAVTEFGLELGLTFLLLMDPGNTVHDLYRVRGYPTSFFVARDGFVAQQHVGIMSDAQLNDYLAKLGLAE